MSENRFPPGWDEARVERVLAYYEGQSDEEAMAEDEAALSGEPKSLIRVPTELVPAVRDLIAKYEASKKAG